MKRILLIICITIFSFNISFTKSYLTSISQNFLLISDSIYADKFETTVKDYTEFLNSLKNTDYDLYTKCLPDITNFSTKKQFSRTGLKKYYFAHKIYYKHPIICVSYFAAKEYCKWLTTEYHKLDKRKFNQVLFKLPAESEWVKAYCADNITRLPLNHPTHKNVNGSFIANIKEKLGSGIVRYSEDGSVITTNLTYEPNSLGLYNIVGNVAEMIDERGIAKGGCWDSFYSECSVDNILNYNISSTDVGFRVFMKVIKSDNIQSSNASSDNLSINK